jgi:hypothetical protein
MDVWTAIKLRSAGLKNAYLGAFGEAKHVDYAGHAGLGRMNRIHLIMKLRCRASKVVNFITSTKRGKVTLCRRSSSRSFALIRSLFAEKIFKDYPKLRTRAKRCGADIFFLDEAGVRSDSALQRTWGAKGETPVVQTSGQRQGVNSISAVNPQGTFWYNVYSCAAADGRYSSWWIAIRPTEPRSFQPTSNRSRASWSFIFFAATRPI